MMHDWPYLSNFIALIKHQSKTWNFRTIWETIHKVGKCDFEKTQSKVIRSKNINFQFSTEICEIIAVNFWCKSTSHPMILHPIIAKNMRGIPQTETIYKIADVVAKISFPLFFTVSFYLIICYLWPLTIYTWTECTDNCIAQTLMSGQVASLHVLQKSCWDSQARFEENVMIFVQKSDGLYRNIWQFTFSCKTR